MTIAQNFATIAGLAALQENPQMLNLLGPLLTEAQFQTVTQTIIVSDEGSAATPDPRTDPHSADPHSADPHSADPHSADPHSADPHSADPHSADPHSADPHSADSGSADGADV